MVLTVVFGMVLGVSAAIKRNSVFDTVSMGVSLTGRRHPGFRTVSPEHVDSHRMVDRLDPDQVHALRAAAQQLLRPRVGHQDSGQAQVPASESLLADEPVRDFSFIGLFNGAPDLAERSEEILREEFAKRADADR
jgi:hypothetical protein